MGVSARRRAILPEVIQTSATDCGPASMKSALAGLGLHVDYRGLREACQTDVDGSSINTLEELSNQLGLEAEQIMLPPDHLLLPEAKALPAIVIATTPRGRPHFVVVWRRVGPFVLVMDPATGRHWTTVHALRARLFIHTAPVPAAAWREWAGSDEAVATLRRRLRDLGIDGEPLLAEALADPSHRSVAGLDAAIRAVAEVAQAGAVRRGRTAEALVRSMMEQERSGATAIPESDWSVRPKPAEGGGEETGGEEELLLHGAVLLRFRGWRAGKAPSAAEAAASAALAPDVASALLAPEVSPARTLFGLLAEDRWGTALLATVGLVLVTGGRIVQALMLRGVLDLGRDLATVKQRALGMLVLAAFAGCLLAIQIPISAGLLGIGRRLEVRLRKAYFEKLPKIEDRYFQSRLASDMASRCHVIQVVRTLPGMAAQFLTIVLELVATAVALIWAAPAQWGLVTALLTVTLALPLIARGLFFEPDMRVQTHTGALSAYVLDALLGLSAIRVHGAEQSLRRNQESLLVEWTKSRNSLLVLSVVFEGLLTAATLALVVLLVFAYLRSSTNAALVLLVVFWALRFPTLGQRLLVLMRGFPTMLNQVRRLLEVIGAIDAPVAVSAPVPAVRTPPCGVEIALDKVKVLGGGHVLLNRVSVHIAPGEHVAIVGPSGAGKSTLVGLLLGWLRPAKGEIRVDGEPLDQATVERLRAVTAWVNPAIQLWNQSLLENLRYGNDSSGAWSLDSVLKGADLLDILEAMPDGLQSFLGEGGALVSGGQGQRIRLARAMLRANVRLAILDEPFRGLDGERRMRLLAEARRLWKQVTLLCVTHDIEQTQQFNRVLVIEGGRVVENGPPAELLANAGSRYAQLVAADRHNKDSLWRGAQWRRWQLAEGVLQESPGG